MSKQTRETWDADRIDDHWSEFGEAGFREGQIVYPDEPTPCPRKYWFRVLPEGND
jgi:hypothetical protein